jgi:hypothetical protein
MQSSSFFWAYAKPMPSSCYTSSLNLDFAKECDVKREPQGRRQVKLRELLCGSANMMNLSAWWAEPLLYDNLEYEAVCPLMLDT